MLIVANWKAYVENTKKAKELVALSKRLVRKGKLQIVIAPPAPLLGTLASSASTKVAFAAQDISATTGGAKTGESVAQTYLSVGATYAIVGHSERRAMGDTNAIIAEKLSHAVAHGLIPILCIGEIERDSDGRYLAFVREQLTSALAPLSLKQRSKVLLAYEPVWAINKTAGAAIGSTDLAEMILYIRKVLSELFPGKSGLQIPVLYGGSVEAGNARDLAASTGIDGFLVGHASVDLRSFTELVKSLS